jgi:putative protease
MADKKIGVIDHYYDKIGVAVIKLESGKLKVGDKIKVFDREGNELFEQEVASMQINGTSVDSVKKGDDFGMKIDQKVKEGYEVHLVKE